MTGPQRYLSTPRTLRLRSAAAELALAAALGGIALIEHRRLSPGARFAYRGALAAVTAVSTWRATRPSFDDPVVLAGPARLGIAAAGAGLVLAGSEWAEKLDGRIVDGLARRGVGRPRVLLAGVTAGLSLLAGASEVWAARRGSEHEIFGDDVTVERHTDLPEGVPALLDAILDEGAALGLGTEALRAQLSLARRLVHGDDGDGWIEFAVPDSAPPAFPRSYEFPVRLEFASPEGIPLAAVLEISDGHLQSFGLRPVERQDEDAWDFTAPEWTALDAARICIDGPEGTRERPL